MIEFALCKIWGSQFIEKKKKIEIDAEKKYGALSDLVPFVQFKKREKHPSSSVTFSVKSNIPPWVFSTFLKLCTWH